MRAQFCSSGSAPGRNAEPHGSSGSNDRPPTSGAMSRTSSRPEYSRPSDAELSAMSIGVPSSSATVSSSPSISATRHFG
ncbi:Uncharacterised protein [Mycobacterium tuberculosis]|nr:Uncharacterised protein [Mycobacterium tuberculosis]